MNVLLLRWSALAFVGLTLTVVLSGCILPGGGYGYGGGDYYEPYGVEYGGWVFLVHLLPVHEISAMLDRRVVRSAYQGAERPGRHVEHVAVLFHPTRRATEYRGGEQA